MRPVVLYVCGNTVFQCSSASRKFLNVRVRQPRRSGAAVSVLFSEPKIPQSSMATRRKLESSVLFQCSSASRKFLNSPTRRRVQPRFLVSVLFSEPKIPQLREGRYGQGALYAVSVLFSEPKIPQLYISSSLSSHSNAFQCSSASRKFLNVRTRDGRTTTGEFQCSSASRKFLNAPPSPQRGHKIIRFSALQRAENSSISPRILTSNPLRTRVSVLFSEPKIPQSSRSSRPSASAAVSVLFSEPKIPQL